MENITITKRQQFFILLLIGFISLLMHGSQLKKDLVGKHVWRQAQTQSNIINFYEEDMNILNPRVNDRGNGDGIYRMEFPLMQWMVAATYKIFGNHIVICRLWMFLTGLVAVWGTCVLINAIFNNRTMGLIGAFAFNFSPAFYYYTINPFSDNLALCFSVWGLACFFIALKKPEIKYFLASGLLLSLGTLCKLPFVLYFALPFTCFLTTLIKQGVSKKLMVQVIANFIFILLPLAWYGTVIPQWKGNGIVSGITDSSVSLSTITGFLWHHLSSTLPELLLNYGAVLFFIAGFYFMIKTKSFKHSLFPALVVCCLVVSFYFVFEINMIERVHDYYLFPFYPFIFIIVSFGAYNLYTLNKFTRGLSFFLLLLLPFLAYARMHRAWNIEDPGFNKDLLTYKEALQKAVPETALCIAGNNGVHHVFFYYINKKGWGYQTKDLSFGNVKSMMDKGAKYLYIDTLNATINPAINQFQDKLITVEGSIKVYSLRYPVQ
jgi:hypothetical protein